MLAGRIRHRCRAAARTARFAAAGGARQRWRGGVMVPSWADPRELSDLELASRIAARDRAAVRIVTERNNQRLFRVAWSVLKQREEAEDVVQSTYMRGFAAIGRFAGRSSLSTWLTRLALNEALGRARAAQRRRRRLDATSVVDLNDYRNRMRIVWGKTVTGRVDP